MGHNVLLFGAATVVFVVSLIPTSPLSDTTLLAQGQQGVVGGVSTDDGQEAGPRGRGGQEPGARGRGGRGGGRGRGGPPPGPAPRNADGRVVLNGLTIKEVGVWTPRGVSITQPLAPPEELPFQEWSRALFADRDEHELEPHARCKASGAARQFMTPYGVEFVEIPDLERVYIFDIGGPHTYRTIYMDGRSHPIEPTPTNYGHSIGWWDGDTLVVDTIGYNVDFWMDRRGLPHTEQLHTLERFTRTDSNAIQYEITVDDPGAYTDKWSSGFTLGWNPGQELFEYVCQQANYAGELMVGDLEKVDRSSQIIP